MRRTNSRGKLLLFFGVMFLFLVLGVFNSIPVVAAATPVAVTATAGNGAQMGYWLGDGDLATCAGLEGPWGVAVDEYGNIYIADTGHNRIRKVDTNGIITTVAGNGTEGYSGDGGPATCAELANPYSVAVDATGNLFIADTMNNVIRKVDANGIINTVAGNGYCKGNYEAFINGGYSDDNGPAIAAELNDPEAVAVDSSGNIYIADTFNLRIRKVDTTGIITTVAGNGTEGYSGDGEPATSAELSQPAGLAVDAAGNIYFSDQNNNRIRKVDTKGIITTVAGSDPVLGYTGEGEPGTSAWISNPYGLAVDASGNLYIADGSRCIRKLDAATGIITTVAGIFTTLPNSQGQGYSGDGGPATSAHICPFGLAVDGSGNIYFSDQNNNRIRKVDVEGIINTVAGNGTAIASGQESATFTVGQQSYILGGQFFAMDAPPFIKNGRLLVPVRFLDNALGAQTKWDPASQKVTITRVTTGYNVLELTIGSIAMVSSFFSGDIVWPTKTIQIDTPPMIVNGRTYIPARYVAEVLGFKVSWDVVGQKITVSQQST